MMERYELKQPETHPDLPKIIIKIRYERLSDEEKELYKPLFDYGFDDEKLEKYK